MKKLCSCLSILFFITACTSDPESIVPATSGDGAALVAKRTIREPDNILNQYDFAGRLHNQIADAYYGSAILPTSLQGIIDLVTLEASNNPDFIFIKGTSPQTLTWERLEYFKDNPLASVTDAISGSPLSGRGKASFTSFVNVKLPLCDKEEDYDVVYNVIATYESVIISDLSLTLKDKQIILTSTSILRYSAHRKRKPKTHGDHDWEIMITHVAATIEGAGYGTEEAITYALSLGIAENN